MNKITRQTEGIDFNELISDFDEFSKYEPRRGSTFYAKAIIQINKDFYPEEEYRQFDGNWETNEFIHSDEDFDRDEIDELYRVEEKEKIKKYWERIK